MNRELTDRIANAVLYEGYILYPYRPSVKNRQRWTFGGLYPGAYARQTGDAEASEHRTECLVRGTASTAIEVVTRFLHLTHRQVNEAKEGEPTLRPVESLRVGERMFHTWQEAEEREVAAEGQRLGVLCTEPHRCAFSFDGRRENEPIHTDGATVGALTRERRAVAGEVEVSATAVGEGLFRLAVVVRNVTPIDLPASRDDALMRSLVSTHILLGAREGEFVSLTDPPDGCREAASACRNVGVWPVLVGDEGQTDTMLASPIILPDYPKVAPESHGDLFDGTEIDEILSLRILTLTDDEKRQAAAIDGRARALLERTESLGEKELFGLHGTLRDGRRAGET